MEIKVPVKGRSDLASRVRQKEDTTARARDFRVLNPRTGALTGAQRAGHSKLGTNALVDFTPVQHLAEIVYDNPKNTFTALGDSSTVDHQTPTPNSSDCYAVVCDSLGSVYSTDGQTGITKSNAHLTKQWKISLPAKERSSQIRALVVDDLFRVFAGVSSGGDIAKAGLWGYRQLENNKTEQIFEIFDGWFTERLWLDGVTLIAGQNDPTNLRSRIAVYADIGVKNPTLIKEFEVPYPINHVSVSPTDNSIFISHEPNANRGAFPKSPGTTTRAEDLRLEDLPNFKKWAHTWLSSMDVLGVGDDQKNVDIVDGDNIPEWVDKTGNNRNATEIAANLGFTLLKNRFAGTDTLYANGTTQAMKGEAGLSTDFLFRHLNRGLLPCHAKHQFAVVMLVRIPQSDTRSVIFSQNFQNTSLPARDRRIYANASVDGTASFANANGCVQIYEETPSGGASNQASGRGGVTGPGTNATPLPGCFDADGIALLSWVFDHGYDDVTGTPTRSTFRVNGRPVDRWTSRTGFETLKPACLAADLLNGVASSYFQGELMEFFVASDWYDASDNVSTPYTQQRTMEHPNYPDAAWVGVGSQTLIEKIEGILAHRRGVAHKLPSGHEALLEFTANPVNGCVVTVDGVSYTFKTTLTATAGDVLIATAGSTNQANAFQSARNLHHAINVTGNRGVSYSAATVPHPTVWSFGVVENGGNVFCPVLGVQRRESRGASFATTTTAGTFTFTGANWDNTNRRITHASAFLTFVYSTGDTVTLTAGTSATLATAFALDESSTTYIGTVLDANGGTGTVSDNTWAGTVSATGVNWIQNVGGTGATTSATSRQGLLGAVTGIGPRGIYPHNYFLVHNSVSDGGPPSSTSSRSIAASLSSPYGMLTKWDPVNGKLKNAITTGGAGTSDVNMLATSFGGIGYGHVVLTDGSIVCCGPRKALTTVFGTTADLADAVDVRRIVDTDAGFVTTNGATVLRAWTAAPGALTYQYPQLAADKYLNAYIPIFQASNGLSVAVYKQVAASSSLNAALLYLVNTMTDDPKAHAIAIDPEYPDFPSAWVDKRAERFHIATRREGTNTNALYTLRQVSVAPTGLSPRVIARVAVAGGQLHQLNAGGASSLLDASFLSATARFVDSASLYGVRYYTDGTSYKLRDQKNALSGGWRALRGQIPPRGALLERFRKRLIIGRLENTYELAMSQYGDAYGWDFDPQGDSPLSIAAIRSGSNQLGSFGSPITCLCALKDDLCVVGGEDQMGILRGDPAQGGQWDSLFDGIGVAFGRARCFTPDGRFWWLTNQAEIYVMIPGGQPELLSRHIQRDLAKSIDFSVARPELIYDPIRRAIMVYLFPHSTPRATSGFDDAGMITGPGRISWVLELDTMSLIPDEPTTQALTPTAACLFDGDEPEDRVFSVGFFDSYVRQIDNEADSDDGVRIGSEVEIRLLGDNENPNERLYEHLDVLLSDAGDAEYEFFSSRDPNNLGDAVVSGALTAGANHPGSVRVSGAFCALLIKGKSSGTPASFGIERMTIEASELGSEAGT